MFYIKTLFSVVAALSLAAPAFTYSNTYHLSYDTDYDDGQRSLGDVTCAYGEYGLVTHGYNTFQDLPTFPNIGGSPQIRGSNSRYCGSCWELTYTNSHGVSTSLNFTAIDAYTSNSDTFIISQGGIDKLTNGQGSGLGTIPITVVRKSASACGL